MLGGWALGRWVEGSCSRRAADGDTVEVLHSMREQQPLQPWRQLHLDPRVQPPAADAAAQHQHPAQPRVLG